METEKQKQLIYDKSQPRAETIADLPVEETAQNEVKGRDGGIQKLGSRLLIIQRRWYLLRLKSLERWCTQA